MTSQGRKLGINIAGKIKKKFGNSENRDQQASLYHDVPVDDVMVSGKAGQTGHKMTKSSSMGSINNQTDTSSEMIIVDQDDIITLTQDVKSFSDGLARLKAVFSDCTDTPEDLRVTAHERLGEVLSILKNILHRYPALQSTEIFSASGTLINKVKSHNYEGPCDETAEHAFCEAIDQLALGFSSSVSEYLMGDLETSFQEEKDVKTKSCDNLLSASKTAQDDEQSSGDLTPEEIDAVLFKLHHGVDLALQRAKAWSKYMKDISSYIERKAQLEVDYSKSLSKIAGSVKEGLSDEGFLPLQSVYCTALTQDIEYASTCQTTQAVLQTNKFVEPLTERRMEHDKMRKTVKDTWSKELKKMQDSVQNLRKAQAMYVTRQQEYDKAKEQSSKIETDMMSQSSSSSSTSSKIDKRRKMEDDAMHKAAEAETTYKACVAEANCRQQELERTKSELLSKVREQILMCDQVIQSVTIEYFRLLQTITTPIPVQYHTLLETSKHYTPGIQYSEYVRRLDSSKFQSHSEPFVFEPYISANTRDQKENDRKTSTQSTGSASSDHPSPGGSPLSVHKRDRYRIQANAWDHVVGSDTDSASGSSKSSPNTSPYLTSRRDRENGYPNPDVLVIPDPEGVDLHGILQMKGKRRNTTFGVDFQEQVDQCKSAVPPIVTKCLKEIEKRGMSLKGIYRVSGVKSKIEALCQRFERNPELVELQDEHPNVIANVLKLYLRELPEPLLTFSMYSDFVHLAKENMSGSIDKDETLHRLGDLISKLPYYNFRTCAMLMHHLNRVTSHSSVNQMSASNLGIVFAPTLLRPLEGITSLASLVNTPHQTRIVELLIIYSQEIFGPDAEHQLIPGETPIEQIAGNKDEKVPHSLSVPQLSSFKSSQPMKPPSATSKPTERSDRSLAPSGQSAKASEKSVEHLLHTGSANVDSVDPKNSDADFVLPGSAQCDKKDTNSQSSPTVTISEGEETGDLDLHSSDDDLPDILLPDDSNPSQHASQAFPVPYIKGGNVIAAPITSTKSDERISNINSNNGVHGKPSPPQHLQINKDSGSKIDVPVIKILESTPTRDIPPQVRFNIPPSKNNGQRSKPKILVPSIQSLVLATAGGLRQDKENSQLSVDKSGENDETDISDKKNHSSSILSSNLQKPEKGIFHSPSFLRKFMTSLEHAVEKTPIGQAVSSETCRMSTGQTLVSETHESSTGQTTSSASHLSPHMIQMSSESLTFVTAHEATQITPSIATVHQGLQLSPSLARKNVQVVTSPQSSAFQLSPSSLRRSAVQSVQSMYGNSQFQTSQNPETSLLDRSPMPPIKPPLQTSLIQGQTTVRPSLHTGLVKKSSSFEETPFKINPPVFDASQSSAKSLPSPVLQRQSAVQSSPLTVKQGLVSPNLSPILPRHPPVQFKLSLITLNTTSETEVKPSNVDLDNTTEVTSTDSQSSTCLVSESGVQTESNSNDSKESKPDPCVVLQNVQISSESDMHPGSDEKKRSLSEVTAGLQPSVAIATEYNRLIVHDSVLHCSSHAGDLPNTSAYTVSAAVLDLVVTTSSEVFIQSVCTGQASANRQSKVGLDVSAVSTSVSMPIQSSLANSVSATMETEKRNDLLSGYPPNISLPNIAPTDVSNVSAFCSLKQTVSDNKHLNIVQTSASEGNSYSISTSGNTKPKIMPRQKDNPAKSAVSTKKVPPPIPNKPVIFKVPVTSKAMSLPEQIVSSDSSDVSYTVSKGLDKKIVTTSMVMLSVPDLSTTKTTSTYDQSLSTTTTPLDMSIRSADISQIRGQLSPRYRVNLKSGVANTKTTQVFPTVITSVIPDLTVKSIKPEMIPSKSEQENSAPEDLMVTPVIQPQHDAEIKVTKPFSDSEGNLRLPIVSSDLEVKSFISGTKSDSDKTFAEISSVDSKFTPTTVSSNSNPDMSVKYAGTGRGRPAITTKTTLSPGKVGVPGKVPKGPSGIVMGKADIMRGRGGNIKSFGNPSATYPVTRRSSKGSDSISLASKTAIKGHGTIAGSASNIAVGSTNVQTAKKLPAGSGSSPSVKSSSEKKLTPGVSCASCHRKRSSPTGEVISQADAKSGTQPGKSGTKGAISHTPVKKSSNDQTKSSKSVNSDLLDLKKSPAQKAPPMKRGPGPSVKEKRTPFFV